MIPVCASRHAIADRFSRRAFATSAGMALLLTLAGCASGPSAPQIALTGDALVDGNAQLAVALPKDRVLWEYRVAATALRRGSLDEARAKLDDALAQAAANFGNINSEAAKSRRMFR
ncbi:hypothetical protein DB347_25485, partial [Opitutaceae bacterium EW11]